MIVLVMYNDEEVGNGCIMTFYGLFMHGFVVGYRKGFQWRKCLNS